MYNYDNLALEARQRQAELLKQAEQSRLTAVARDKRRFRFAGWRLPALHLGLFTPKPAPARKVSRRTAADHI